MNFLKEILGEELYSQVESKVNEYNGNEANKDKQVKIGNLGTGEYVGKGKYDALQELVNGKETELKEMRRAYTSCECDQESFYLTNSTMPVLKIPCVRCGADVAVSWNSEKECYETIKG